MTEEQSVLTYREAYKHLSEPVPQEQIKTLPNSSVRYTTDKFVQDRLDAVVGAENWSDDYITVAYPKPLQKLNKQGDVLTTFVGVMHCRLTVLGVTKSATFDLEHDNSMYGTPGTNAQATVFKRAAMKHGVARELWKGTEASTVAAGTTTFTAPAGRASNGARASAGQQSNIDPRPFREPTASVLKWLTDLHVPEEIAVGLNGNGTREDPSQASEVISALMAVRKQDYQGYNDDPMPSVNDVLAMHAPDLLQAPPAPKLVPVAAGRKRKPVQRDDEEDE